MWTGEWLGHRGGRRAANNIQFTLVSNNPIVIFIEGWREIVQRNRRMTACLQTEIWANRDFIYRQLCKCLSESLYPFQLSPSPSKSVNIKKNYCLDDEERDVEFEGGRRRFPVIKKSQFPSKSIVSRSIFSIILHSASFRLPYLSNGVVGSLGTHCQTPLLGLTILGRFLVE